MSENRTQDVFNKIVAHPDLMEGMLRTIMAARPEVMAQVIGMVENAGYRALKDVMKHPLPFATGEAVTRVSVLDVETTSLERREGAIIQLSIISFDTDGVRPLNPHTTTRYSCYNDPGHELNETTTSLTGITTDMVRDKRILAADVRKEIEGSSVLIAHKADFDRQYLELHLPEAGFREKMWGCSINDVKWNKFTKSNSRVLSLMALENGYVMEAHNADADTTAVAWLLALERDGETPLGNIMEATRTSHLNVLLPRAPFAKKDLMARSEHFFFNGDTDPLGVGDRVWVARLTEANAREVGQICQEVYGAMKVLDVLPDSALMRYSGRAMPLMREVFATNAPEACLAEIRASLGGNEPRRPASAQGDLLLGDDVREIIPF